MVAFLLYWYDTIGDPTVADAIMDRIIHTAHRTELTGESVRKMAAYGQDGGIIEYFQGV
ncbi:hypothetical protein HMPREF1981_02255, partial [Bacteroides pyogenes F0041]